MSIDILHNAAAEPRARILLAHGAMAPMDSAFMEALSGCLTAHNISVFRFEFAYMAGRRTGGKKRPPPRAERLLEEYSAAVSQLNADTGDAAPLIIGGKSLGGRVASMVADELHADRQIAGLTCLGYPFHPPNKPENLRTAHLKTLNCPALIVQGERDPFGTPDEIAGYTIDKRIQLHWIGDGDHDFGPRGRSGFTKRGNIEAAADAIATFATGL